MEKALLFLYNPYPEHIPPVLLKLDVYFSYTVQ